MPKNQGLVGLIVVIIIAVLIISYFGISIKSVAESPTAQSNFSFIKEVGVQFWNTFLKNPVLYVYHDIWLDLCWRPFVDNLQRLKRGQPTTIEPPAIKLLQ